jgi:hypothetical protein
MSSILMIIFLCAFFSPSSKISRFKTQQFAQEESAAAFYKNIKKMLFPFIEMPAIHLVCVCVQFAKNSNPLFHSSNKAFRFLTHGLKIND